MNQDPESLYDAMPCPQCGCTELLQEVLQTETVHVDENGDPENYEMYDTVETQTLWCQECDEIIWERDE